MVHGIRLFSELPVPSYRYSTGRAYQCPHANRASSYASLVYPFMHARVIHIWETLIRCVRTSTVQISLRIHAV